MKCNIDEFGRLHVQYKNTTEKYAIQEFIKKSNPELFIVTQQDKKEKPEVKKDQNIGFKTN